MQRQKEIKIRLTEEEYDKLQTLVDKTGRSRESYLRSLINHVVPREMPSEELLSILKELRYIGNNLNQIAKIANTTMSIDKEMYMRNVQQLYDNLLEIKTLMAKEIPIDDKDL